ncbi:MAG: glutamine synthetase adenylyltransferase [Anaerolineae bacterium]
MNPYLELLRAQLTPAAAADLLTAAQVTDPHAAVRRLQGISQDALTQEALAACLAVVLPAVAGAASPTAALVSFERFARSAAQPADLFLYLAANPRQVEMLITLFAGSHFLSEILLRNPDYFRLFSERRELSQPKTAAQLYAEAQKALAPFVEPFDQLNALRRFQRWELLRIGAADFFGLLDLPKVTLQLSRLADALVWQCLTMAAWRAERASAGFIVIALGKLGGEELNYSSDIDLLFIARDHPTDYQALSQHLIDALVRATPEGFLYRVDMRLRPWGGVGPLVSSLDGYLGYLRQDARLWEKQALLKARVIAGDDALAADFMQQVQPFIFSATPAEVRTSVAAMKQRTESNLAARGRTWGEVKLGEGSIRDAEFVAQYLQLAHGAERPALRTGKTLEALPQLFSADLITADDYRTLSDGYIFMRAVEHYLQLMHYRQTSSLPTAADELTTFARRLGFNGADAGARFLARYEQQRAAIRAVYLRHLGDLSVPAADPAQPPADSMASPAVQRHLARLDPAYTLVFSEAEIERHTSFVARLSAANLVEVDAAAVEGGLWRVTIVAFDYLGELSLICGLLAVHGFDILDGDVFTYEPVSGPAPPGDRGRGFYRDSLRRAPLQATRPPEADVRQKIVDVFTVRPTLHDLAPDVWTRYRRDLDALLRLLQEHQSALAQGALVKRFAARLREASSSGSTLYPIEVQIDNRQSARYTVLTIEAQDTTGFLYELTNALALNDLYIARVTVDTLGSHVHDTLYVTDARGDKITAPARQRELRAAIVLVKHFTHLLPRSPDPESALLHFRAFLGQLFSQPNWPDELVSLERPEVLSALARLLGVSDFLWNDFLRMQYANLFPVVRDVDALHAARPRAQLAADLDTRLRATPDAPGRRDVLNAFKDREIFRIDMRYILGHVTEFGQFSGELSDLADVVVQATFGVVLQPLLAEHGAPLLDPVADQTPASAPTACPLTVCALGKAGGRELGFASDIELLFIYAGSGQTRGPAVISNAEFYERLVQSFVSTIRAKREGIFEIDLRLRPYGKAGSLAVSLASFQRYFAPGGPAWAYERQALIRLRPLAGDAEFGRQIVAQRDQFVYTGEPFDVAAMRAMRERQLRHLVTAGAFNAKFSPGGAVDIEYLVQGLQINHGLAHPALRLTNTREALAALAQVGILAQDDYERLRDAHMFIRRLVNALRMVRGNTKDLTVPPAASEEYRFLADRLGYSADLERLRADLNRHPTFVQQLSVRLLG